MACLLLTCSLQHFERGSETPANPEKVLCLKFSKSLKINKKLIFRMFEKKTHTTSPSRQRIDQYLTLKLFSFYFIFP